MKIIVIFFLTMIHCHNEIVPFYIRTHHLFFVVVLFFCDLATRELSSPFSVQLLVGSILLDLYVKHVTLHLLCAKCSMCFSAILPSRANLRVPFTVLVVYLWGIDSIYLRCHF